MISAAATVVPLEVETENNILVDGTVTVVFIDLNGDGKIDIRDVATVAVAFGSIKLLAFFLTIIFFSSG